MQNDVLRNTIVPFQATGRWYRFTYKNNSGSWAIDDDNTDIRNVILSGNIVTNVKFKIINNVVCKWISNDTALAATMSDAINPFQIYSTTGSKGFGFRLYTSPKDNVDSIEVWVHGELF